MKTRWGTVLAVAAFRPLGLLFAAGRGEAQSRAPSLPSDCSSGEFVVSRGGGEFRCVPGSEALRLSGCDAGDFVGMGSSGRMECISPSSTSWDVRGLLPDCSSGQMLVSEGFGRWRCTEAARAAMPDCSSNEMAVSEGSGRWRCMSAPRSPIPECSSGETLVSEGYGRWRCGPRP
jgi:hypothetical protein